MRDLAFARLRLKEGFTLVIVKGGMVIFETRSHGIAGFLQAIEKLDNKLVKSSLADKIVGIAASLLCAYSKVGEVFAITISKGGSMFLKITTSSINSKNASRKF